MPPLTSPNQHSQVKPASSIEFNKTIEAFDSNIDNAEGINSDAVMLIQDMNDKCILDKFYRPEFMHIDGTSNHSINISLKFTYMLNQKVYTMSMYITEKVQ